MFYTHGISEIVKSICSVCNVATPVNDLDDIDLKNAYHLFLNKQSVIEIPIDWYSIRITDFPGLKCMALNFCKTKSKFFAVNSLLLEERLSGNFFNNALEKLKKQSKEIFDLAQFIIKIVLVNHLDSYTNGISDETIGLSSIDFKDYFEEQDFIEIIIHQLTHMILFIDDYSNSHMLNDIKEKIIETGLQHKINGNKFPVYSAFHSFIVGAEVLCFRGKTTGFEFNGKYHGSTQRIIRVSKEFQKSLSTEQHLFTDRGRSIFEKAQKLFSEMSHQYEYVNLG